jgi:ribosomal protein L7/L12
MIDLLSTISILLHALLSLNILPDNAQLRDFIGVIITHVDEALEEAHAMIAAGSADGILINELRDKSDELTSQVTALEYKLDGLNSSENEEFEVQVCFHGNIGYNKKIPLIKILCEITQLGIKEAKDFIERCDSNDDWAYLPDPLGGAVFWMNVQEAKDFVSRLNAEDSGIAAQVRLRKTYTF